MESMRICRLVSLRIRRRQHYVTLKKFVSNELLIKFLKGQKSIRKNFVPKLTECWYGLLASLSFFLSFGPIKVQTLYTAVVWDIIASINVLCEGFLPFINYQPFRSNGSVTQIL